MAAAASATMPHGTPIGCGDRSRSTTASASAPTKCPYAQECFAEKAKEQAASSQVIVTNHSLLAIDAIEGVPMIPDYDTVVIDEAHELVARVTQAATDELTFGDVERAGRRAGRYAEGDAADDLLDAAEALKTAMASALPAGSTPCPRIWATHSSSCVMPPAPASLRSRRRGRAAPTRRGPRPRAWSRRCSSTPSGWRPTRSRTCCGSPRVATGLRPGSTSRRWRSRARCATGSCRTRPSCSPARPCVWAATSARSPRASACTTTTWSTLGAGLDVGSPFDYGQQAILYVARHLPPPGRDGMSQATLDEICELVDAADGRTLGLFSSRRAAEVAAEVVRERLPHLTTLAQGDAQLPELAKQFVADPHTCLFGTLSLWQGLDVPGETCQLVLIDRIPFPRPDDPLMSARQRAADRAGGNGFMQVAATHAALLLAQGSGRLIRTTSDRGVVAVLDPRLVTARYGGFLRASLPPMWTTSDPALVRGALKRLSAE